MSKIHVIHENDAWVEPLRAAFDEQGLPYEEWFLSEGTLDLSSVPPQGVFYNRMSASSHTRDHRYAAELTGGVLAWLQSHGRRVVNDSRALALEISKVAQYEALRAYGIRTPRTIAAVGKKHIIEAAGEDGRPLHHQAQPRGQGTGRQALPVRGRARRARERPGVRGVGGRHHADPAIHPRDGAVHHARGVRGWGVPLRGARRHVARLRALSRGRVPGGGRISAR